MMVGMKHAWVSSSAVKVNRQRSDSGRADRISAQDERRREYALPPPIDRGWKRPEPGASNPSDVFTR